MTIDPIIVTAVLAAMTAMGGLLLYFLRGFASGSILPRSTVRREDYEAQVAIVKSYAAKFGEQTTAVKGLAKTVAQIAARDPG